MLLSCQKQDEGVSAEQAVQFSFSYTAAPVTGGRTEDDLAEAAFVYVTVNDAAHHPVKVGQKLQLINFNGRLISEPISLLPGHYLLYDFLVLDKWGNVIFATPRENTEWAYLVADPLDIALTISKDKVAEFSPEVLSARDRRPEAFGYASFTFQNIKTFDFLIAVSAYDTLDNKLNLTEAQVSVFDGSHHPILQRMIPAATSRLTLPDGDENFAILVEKKGYPAYKESFSTSELKQYLGSAEKGPLVVTLRKGHLVFWNSLGSDTEVLHSVAGPALSLFTDGGGIHIPANREYKPGVSGNAITIGPGNYGVAQRVHNVILNDPGKIIDPMKGAIECYFFQNQSPVAYSHNPHRIFDGAYGLLSGLGFMSHDYNEDGLINALTFYLVLGGATVTVSSMDFNAYNGQWVHVAAVWDWSGINGTKDTMRIYINGEKAAAGQDIGWGTVFGTQADIAGGNDNNIARQFFVDEMKIYDYAKTAY